MSNILKKLSALIVMLAFMGLFSVVVSATETTQNTSIEGNVILSEDEYNDLIERVEELEQLKEKDINNNLFNYYEKSKVDRDTSISAIEDRVSNELTFLGIILTIFLAGTAFLNFREMKSVAKKAEETNKKAQETNEKAEKTNKESNKIIEEVNEQLVISKTNIQEMDKKLIQYDENVHSIEQKLLELDETKIKLDLYIEKSKAQTTNDIDLSIEIYDNVIDKMEQLKLEDEYIYYQLGDACLSKFKIELRITEDYKSSLKLEIKNLENIYTCPGATERYDYLLTDAIFNFEKFLEKSSTSNIYTKAELKIVECLLYKKEYEEMFTLLNDIDCEEIKKQGLRTKIVALIIMKPDLYELFSKCTMDNHSLSCDIKDYLKAFRSEIFNTIFANELLFDIFCISENENETYIKLIKKLDKAYKLYYQLMNCDALLELNDILGDFNTCSKFRDDDNIDFTCDDFYVFNNYCAEFLYKLDDERYNKIVDTLTQMSNGEYKIETT